MKYSKSAIGLLTAQYRSVLKKCWMINVGLFALGAALATPAMSEVFDIKYTAGSLKDGSANNVTAASPGDPVIATLTLTATDIKSILGNSGSLNADTATTATEAGTANAVRLNTAVHTDAGTPTGKTIGEYINKITALETAGYVTSTYVDENYAKKTDIANVAKTDGSSVFSSIKIGTVASNGELSYSNESGKIYTDKAFQATGNLIVKSATDNTVSAALGVDKSGANSRLTADNFKATNLYIGSSDAITGVASTISDNDIENAGKLASASAVKASVDGVKSYADGLSSAVYDGSNTFAKFKMDSVEVDGITAASESDNKKLITETAVDNKISTATTGLSSDVATLKGGKDIANSVLNSIDNQAENAKYTGAATANSIGAAIKGNADKLAGLVVDTGDQETVQNAIDKAKTEAQAYSGTAVSGAATVSAAIDKNATSIADLKDASKEGSIAKLIQANAKDATYDGDITISEAISAASGSIGTETLANANGNLNGGTAGTFTGSVKAAINGLDATLGKIYGLATGGKGNLASTGDTVSGHLSALDNAIGNRTTAYGTSNYAATGNADLNVATAIKNLDTAVYNNLNGISTDTLNIGGSAKDVHIGKTGQGLNIAGTGSSLLVKDGSTVNNGLTIGGVSDATSSLGFNNGDVFKGIRISQTTNKADTVTITDGTNNVVFKGGKMTANGAELSTLKMGANEAKGIDTGTNYAATDATAPAADNIQLASTATVYNSVHALAGQMGNFETIANVHGVNGTENIKFGEKANNIRIGSENEISGNKVLATGIDVNGLVSGTKGINLRVAKGSSSDDNTSVNVTESQVKLGSTVGGKFYGITSNYDGTEPAESSIKFNSDNKYVEVKGGNLNATGDIKTAAGTVEGAHLKATTDLKIGDFTPVVGVDAGTSDLDNTADNTMLASAKTVYRAMSSAQGYTPADALKADTHIFNGVTTNKAALDIVGTKLDGLTMADGTTAAATVQAALQNVKSAADTAVNNLKDGDVAANKAKLAGLVVDPNASPAAEVTVQNAINYAKAQAGVYTSATGMQAESKIFNGKTTFTDAMDAAGAGIMANTARFAGFASDTQTVAEYVTANADSATHGATTIGAAINANTAVIDKDNLVVAAADAENPTVQKAINYAKTAAATDAQNKVDALADDLASSTGTKAVNGAHLVGLSVATDKLADNAVVWGKLGTDVQNKITANETKLAGLSKSTVQASIEDAIATAGTTADGKYVAKTDLTPANGQVVLGHASTDNYNDKGTDFTVDTANSTIKATVFKPSSASDMTRKTSTMEMDKDGVTFTTAEVETSGTTTKTASIKDGVVSAEGLKLGTNDVTSIDSGAALDITTDVADADKKVRATDAAVKATVKALADGAVKTNTDRFAGFTNGQTVAQYVDANADSAKHGSTTIGDAITANTTKLADLTNDTVQASINAAKSGLDNRINKVLTGNTLVNKVTGTNGEAMIFNESDGGGAMFTHKTTDNVVDGKSYVGVHDGSSNLDIGAQIYVLDGSDNGVRLNANLNGIYYVKGAAGQGNPAKAEIVTLGTAQNADYTQPTDTRTSIGSANTIQTAIDAVAAATDTNTTNIDTNTQAIAKLNSNKTVENSVDYKVYNNAKDAKYDDSGKSIKTAIQEAASGASDALAKVLNGETKFNKAKIGNDWAITENGSKRLTVRDIASDKPVMSLDKGTFSLNKIADDGSSNAYLVATGNSFTLSNSEGQYFNVSASGFNVGNKEDPSFTINPVNGNVKAKGTVAAAGLKVGESEVMNGVDNGREALTENTASPTTLASAATVYTTVQANAEKATYTPATGQESAAVITAQANTINGAILALDENAVATNNAIGTINNLHGSDNAMVNRGEGDAPGDPAANIVEALNNISASVGNVHGLATAAANGKLDEKYASQHKPADWYKNGAGNLFPGSATDDHLAELAASIGERNYANTEVYGTTAIPYLNANESVATSLVALARNLGSVADDYVKQSYFDNGEPAQVDDGTGTMIDNPDAGKLSMGSGAKNITIGSATNNVVVDNANHTIGATIDTSATDETINALTMDNTKGVKLATTKGLGSAAKTKNVAINNGVVTADDSLVASDTTAATSSTIKADGSATFKGANKTASIVDGDITADDINAATVTATTITGTTVNATTLAMVAGGEATAIDNAGTVMTAAPTDEGKTLASTLTVYNNIKDATTVAAAPNGNYAAGSVKDALKTVDSRMGNVSWYKNSKHYANPNSTAGLSLSAAIRNIDANVYAKVGDVDFADTMNYVSSADTDLTKAIKSMDTNVKAAIGGLDNKYVTQAYFNNGEPAKLPDDSDNPNAGLILMGRSASSIQIGAQNFSGTGPTGLNSGIQIDVTRNGSGSITDSTISIGTNGNSSFDGIKVSSNGTNVVIGNSAGDKVTIAGGAVTATGAVQGASLVATAATDGLSINGKTASTIDNDGTVMTAAPTDDGKTLASTLTVYNNIQDATVFKAAEVATAHNYAAGDTVKQAIASLDGVVGDIESYRGTKYANTSSTEDVDLAHAVINLDTAIFNVTKDYVTKTYFNGGEDAFLPDGVTPNPKAGYISMGSLAKKVTIGADDSARIVLDVTDAAKKSITMTAGTDMQVALNGTEITIGDKDGQGIKVDNDGKTTTFTGSTAAKKVVVNEGVVTASDGVVVGDKTGAKYAEITTDTATFKGANGTVTIADGTVTAKKFAFSDTAYATGIDNTGGVFTAAPADNYTIATTKTVYDNTYLTAAATNGNYAAGSVVNALRTVDSRMGNVSWYKNSTHYANPNSTAGLSLSAAIKNIDENVYAKVGAVDFADTMNYVSSADTDLTRAIKSMDTNVKAEINSLDNKFVTKEYFNNGEPAQIDDGTGTMIDNPNAGLISMGSGATQINIGKTVPAGTPTSAVLDSGLSINNTNGDVMLGQISQVGSGATAKSVVETGVNVDNATHTASLISANGQSSINAVDVNQTTIKLGMTTTDTSANPLFSGVSINNGVMTNAKPGDATGAEKATFAYNEVKVASSATDYTSTTAAGTTVTKKDGDKTYTRRRARRGRIS